MGRPVHVLLNPSGADRAAGRRWRQLEPQAHQLFGNLELHESVRPGELTEIAAAIARSGRPSLVIAAGGDGTSHEVINGLIENGHAINPDALMGWLALGSGNDLARALGFAGSRADPLAAFRALETATIDVGQAAFTDSKGAPRTVAFGNSFTIGVTTDVLQLVAKSGKPLGGKVAYFLGAVRAILRHQPTDLVVTEDGRPKVGPAWLVSITNGPTFGAGMRITPDARFDDGLLDTVRIIGHSRLVLLSVFPRVYWGSHLTHRGVEHGRAATVVIDAPGPLHFEADGELYHGWPPFRVSVSPGGLPIVRPARGLQDIRPHHSPEAATALDSNR